MNPNASKNQSLKSRSESTAASPDVSDALQAMRKRSPQESLGVNTQGGLMMGFLIASAAVGILLFAWTAGAYVYDRKFPPPAKASKKEAVEGTENTSQTPPPTNPEASIKKNPEGSANPGKTPGKKDILDVLGETGTKKGAPVNPLDKKEDDLLKDLK